MILFSIVYGLLFVGTNMGHAVTPAFFQSMGYGSYMFGVAFACMSLTNFLLSPFWGAYAGRLGYIRCFIFGILGYAAGQAFSGLARAELVSALARLFTGLFVSSFSISGVLYVSHLGGENKRGKYVAYLAATQTACSAAGYFLGGMLGTVSIAAAFIGQSAVCLTAALLAAVLIREEKSADTDPVSLRMLNPFRSFLDMRSVLNGVMAVFLAVTFFSSFTTNCFDNTFNYYIRDQFGFPTSYNGAIKAAVGLLGMAANFLLNPWLVRRGRLRSSIVGVFFIGMLMLLALNAARTVPLLLIFAMAYYLANAVYLPIQQTLGAQDGRGKAYGAFMSIRSLGQMAGGLLAGLLYTLGARVPFYAAALGFGLAMILSAVNVRQTKNENQLVKAQSKTSGAKGP